MSARLREEFLRQPHIGVIATLRRDGRPYTVPVWWLWHDGAFWLTGTAGRIWCRQLRRDPRASLCIEATHPHPGHVGVDGVVDLLQPPEFDIWPITRRLAEKYVGLGDPGRTEQVDHFFERMRTEPRILLRLHPHVWRAIDMSVYEGKRSDRDHQARVQAAREAEAGAGP